MTFCPIKGLPPGKKQDIEQILHYIDNIKLALKTALWWPSVLNKKYLTAPSVIETQKPLGNPRWSLLKQTIWEANIIDRCTLLSQEGHHHGLQWSNI